MKPPFRAKHNAHIVNPPKDDAPIYIVNYNKEKKK